MRFEAVQPVRPLGVGAPEPVVDRKQALQRQSRWAALAVAATLDQPSPLQHLEMFGDGRLRQRRGLGQFDDPGLTGAEALEDRATRGVGEGGEREAEWIRRSHHP